MNSDEVLTKHILPLSYTRLVSEMSVSSRIDPDFSIARLDIDYFRQIQSHFLIIRGK